MDVENCPCTPPEWLMPYISFCVKAPLAVTDSVDELAEERKEIEEENKVLEPEIVEEPEEEEPEVEEPEEEEPEEEEPELDFDNTELDEEVEEEDEKASEHNIEEDEPPPVDFSSLMALALAPQSPESVPLTLDLPTPTGSQPPDTPISVVSKHSEASNTIPKSFSVDQIEPRVPSPDRFSDDGSVDDTLGSPMSDYAGIYSPTAYGELDEDGNVTNSAGKSKSARGVGSPGKKMPGVDAR